MAGFNDKVGAMIVLLRFVFECSGTLQYWSAQMYWFWCLWNVPKCCSYRIVHP